MAPHYHLEKNKKQFKIDVGMFVNKININYKLKLIVGMGKKTQLFMNALPRAIMGVV